VLTVQPQLLDGVQADPGTHTELLYVSAYVNGMPRPALFIIGTENITLRLALLMVSNVVGVMLENGGTPVATWPEAG
jgi:hypothetical protein